MASEWKPGRRRDSGCESEKFSRSTGAAAAAAAARSPSGSVTPAFIFHEALLHPGFTCGPRTNLTVLLRAEAVCNGSARDEFVRDVLGESVWLPGRNTCLLPPPPTPLPPSLSHLLLLLLLSLCLCLSFLAHGGKQWVVGGLQLCVVKVMSLSSPLFLLNKKHSRPDINCVQMLYLSVFVRAADRPQITKL